MKTAAYIGNFGFPDHNASGKRVYGNCRLLQALGYRIVCIGPGARQTQLIDGITLYSIDAGNEIERVLKKRISSIKEIIEKENTDAVFLYGALVTQIENLRLINWCHRQNIRVFYDHVDWLDLNWHNPLRGIVRAGNYWLLSNKVIPACDGVICISSFLSKLHRQKGKKTVIIPPLSVEINDAPLKDDRVHDTVQFVYAGTTSDINRPTSQWKDRIDIMLEKLLACTKEQNLKPFVINIYGMTEAQYLGMFPAEEKERGRDVMNELGERVVFHGIVPNHIVMEKTGAADFTILIRDKKRATMSGFPTKVSESIGCGTPVLCNDTSDIKNYIVNGKTGFVMDDIDKMFRIALTMPKAEIMNMKKQCGENPFYYLCFENQMKAFLEG